MFQLWLILTILFLGCTFAQDNVGNDTYSVIGTNITTDPVPEPSTPVYVVTTILADPWVFMKEVEVDGKKEAKFEGFAIDILDELAKDVNFRYVIHRVKDERYGFYDEKRGLWTGMIGELVRMKADIAVADLTITKNREEVVNFTKPIMSSSYRTMIRRPEEFTVNVMFLLYPFTAAVWILLMVVFVVVAFLMYLINRFSPYEWSRVQAEKDVRRAKFSFNLRNSFLFVVSTITLQGYREAPKSYSGRILAAIWWCFSLILNFAYIASLVAILISLGPQKPTLPFKTIKQMTMQSDVVYGAPKYSRLLAYFRNSEIPMHKEMFSFMTNKGTLFATVEEAKRHVENGGAAILESTQGEYVTSHNCDMMLVGESMFSNGLGFAMRPGLSIQQELSIGILRLSDSGTLQRLRNKWWRRTCPDVDENDYDAEIYKKTVRSQALKIAHVSFAFIILLVGVLVAALVLLLENLYHRMNGKRSWTLRKPKKQTPEETPLDKTADETLLDGKQEKSEDAPEEKEVA